MVEYVNTQVESLQVFDGTKDVQRYGELEIDIYRRTVTKKDKEIK